MKLYYCRKCGRSFKTTFEGNLCLACLSNKVELEPDLSWHPLKQLKLWLYDLLTWHLQNKISMLESKMINRTERIEELEDKIKSLQDYSNKPSPQIIQ